MLTVLSIEGYRSIRRLVLPLTQLNVVIGANGSGKSSLYRSIRLLAEVSRNGAVAALAREGGLPSTLWAGPEVIGRAVREGTHPVQGTVRKGPVALRLGFTTDQYGYAVDFGLPQGGGRSAFGLDPEIKAEVTWAGPCLRRSATLTERHRGVLKVREPDGSWWTSAYPLATFDSMLSEYADPERAPELLELRRHIRSWRFYDQFRTDAGAPARQVQVSTRTPVLDHDGADLAAALQTIIEMGDPGRLGEAIDRAFEGSELAIEHDAGTCEIRLRQPGLLRPLSAAELSDGTLRYLLWVAALLSPRPPELLVLNEPETSLHPDVLPALGELIARSSQTTQTLVVTHSATLQAEIARHAAATHIDHQTVELVKEFGETQIEGRDRFGVVAWEWPKR